MKRIKSSSATSERRILIGCITDSVFLGHFAAQYQPDMLRSSWSDLVAKWCIAHFEKYHKAPGKSIESRFVRWSERAKDEDTINTINTFLGGLSQEYDQTGDYTTEYLLDLATDHVNRVRAEKLTTKLQNALQTGESPVDLIAAYTPVRLRSDAGIAILHDKQAIKQVFAEPAKPLLEYPGILGKFFGDRFARDGFISFMGAEKRGKSWLLLDVAVRAALDARKNVVMFQVGDMSQNQVMERFLSRFAGWPLRPCKARWPVAIRKTANGVQVRHKVQTYGSALNWKRAWDSCCLIVESKICSDIPTLRLFTSPAGTVSVTDIRAQIQQLQRDNWLADLIIIDYADLLAAPPGIRETRDQINRNWTALRALAQEFHCLVVTATQSDTASYSAHTMSRKHFSDDKRKLAHVTGMVGINATEEEEDKEIQRLNWIVVRKGKFTNRQTVAIAGCRDLCHPTVLSC